MAQDLKPGQGRACDAHRADILPAYRVRLGRVIIRPLPLDVDWTAIAKPALTDRYAGPDFWTDIYVEPLSAALEQVGRDDAGKTALAAGPVSVRVTWALATAPVSASENGLTFVDGVLTVNFEPWSDGDDVVPRADAIVKVFESGL